MPGCGGATVFKLRRCVQRFAGEHANLDADVAIGSGDSSVSAVETGSSILPDAHAERTGFGEDEALQRRAVRWVTEDGQQSSRAAFLHDYGRQHDVERSLRKRSLGDEGQDLRG